MSNKFSNGSIWVRFDCHLHTRADREFKYAEHENEIPQGLQNALNQLNN